LVVTVWEEPLVTKDFLRGTAVLLLNARRDRWQNMPRMSLTILSGIAQIQTEQAEKLCRMWEAVKNPDDDAYWESFPSHLTPLKDEDA
jgi:hypothetical protein